MARTEDTEGTEGFEVAEIRPFDPSPAANRWGQVKPQGFNP
jgi:hypothetical protein